MKVLHETGRKAKSPSRMWVYCGGGIQSHSNILFEYQPTRNGDHAAKFLEGYRRYLVCDGYDGYKKTATRCGCWAHMRRKFVDALPTDQELLSNSAAARGGVEYCNWLFQLEREFAVLGSSEHGTSREVRTAAE